jgi:hypothetical protein
MTDAADIVARQLTRSGETFLLAMEPLTDEEFFAVNGNGFSAAWVTGHLTCVADLFSSWIDGELLFHQRFHQLFNDTGINVTEAGKAVDPVYYPKDILLQHYREAYVRALRELRRCDAWGVPAPAAAPVTLRTAGDVWEHLAVHTYWHLGELAGSMPRFRGTYTLNILPHHLYVPPG